MSDTTNTETILKSETTKVQPVLDKLGRSYATGKRKNAVARVWIKSGSGKITINGKEIGKYFLRPVLNMLVNQPLELTNKKLTVDTIVTAAPIAHIVPIVTASAPIVNGSFALLFWNRIV